MNWWLVGLVVFDIYVVCGVVVAWAIKTAPLIETAPALSSRRVS